MRTRLPKVGVALVFSALPLVGCSDTSTGPATTAPSTSVVSTPPTSAPNPITSWQATSTVTAVSTTVNTCPVDHTVGQTRIVDWAVEANVSPSASIGFQESGVNGDPFSNPGEPFYYGSRTGDQFVTIAEQDGQTGCFVWHGDFTGSFSADGRAFDAAETIRYTYFGQQDMVVSRHWTATRIQ